MQRLIIITGERQAGKSTLCRILVARAREANVQVSGLITRHTGPHDLEVEELQTATRYSLTRPYKDVSGPLKRFNIDERAFERSTRALSACFPTRLFVLDEIGPLELVHHQGWYEGITLLRDVAWEEAIIVIRPELLQTAICELPAVIYTVINVTEANRDRLPDKIWGAVLHKQAFDSGVE